MSAERDWREGWVIIHPDGRTELDYFHATKFSRKALLSEPPDTPDRVECSQEEWQRVYRPKCQMVRMQLVLPAPERTEHTDIQSDLFPLSDLPVETRKEVLLNGWVEPPGKLGLPGLACEQALERWKTEVYDRACEFDPHNAFDWYGVALAFFVGCGLTIPQAEQLIAEQNLEY